MILFADEGEKLLVELKKHTNTKYISQGVSKRQVMFKIFENSTQFMLMYDKVKYLGIMLPALYF